MISKSEVPALIVVGTGRCGSSSLHSLLAYHPGVAWLSQHAARFPDRPGVSRACMRLLDAPLPVGMVRRLVRPSEAYPFWDLHYGGFSRPCRDLVAEDVTVRVARRLRGSLASIRTARRDQLLLKVTGWPRLGFIAEVLPAARFVHIYRDGRDVAYSCLGRAWWAGWEGLGSWVAAGLDEDQTRTWKESGFSYLVLAALEWEMLMQAFETARQGLPDDRVLDLRYEDLCTDPGAAVERILGFAGLSHAPEIDAALGRSPFVNANGRWRSELSASQQLELQAPIEEALRRYGYLPMREVVKSGM